MRANHIKYMILYCDYVITNLFSVGGGGGVGGSGEGGEQVSMLLFV